MTPATPHELLTIALLNIASGTWNAGRDVPISVNEYAQEALKAAGLAKPPSWSGHRPT